MIIRNKNIHIIRIVVALVLLFIAVFFSFNIEKNRIMGVRLISNEEYDKLLLQKDDNLNIDFLFNNESAAVDYISKVIYISQNITEKTELKDIQGTLSTQNPNYELVMKKDYTYSLWDTVSNGDNISIIAIIPDGSTVEYKIIFTSLPLINITGSINGIADNGQDLLSGTLTFFDPVSAETGGYRTVSSDVEWHIRGNTTAKQSKKPWKLALKNQNGANKNLSLCGLGEDDDWILNPMNLDDLKMREKLMMDLWNRNEYFTENNLLMSQCEYVEVVLNGEYCGLYLLQRRLDKKYLDVDKEDILLKSRSMAPQPSVSSETMEIVYSPFSEEDTIKYLQDNFDNKYIEHTNIDNWVEMTGYLGMACSVDNRQTKNIVMLLDRGNDNNYTVNYLLWDTDMSFGLHWEAGYVYDYNRTVNANVVRFEYKQLTQIYPDLDSRLAINWNKLRQTIFNDENLYNYIDKLYNTITYSGSLQRDIEKWGVYYEGADTMEQLYTFIDARMEYLDNYFSVSKN